MAKVPKAKRNSGVSSKPTPLAKRVAEPVATRPLWNLSTGWSVAIGLALLGGVLAALRWHFLDIPLERDESAYAYIGKQILDGALPYRDVYEMKPPLLLYSYAALVALFGYSQEGLHMAAMFLTFWNAAWSMAIGMRFFGRFYGFLAGLCYVLLAVNPFAYAIFAESELVLMGFVLPGLYCFMHWEHIQAQAGSSGSTTPEGNGWLYAGGFLLACGTLVKQSGVFFFGVPAIQLALAFWQQKPLRGRLLLRRGAWLAAGVATPVATCLLLMRALGVWDEFWFWNVQYVQIYSSSLKRDLWALAFTSNFNLLTKNFVLYWVLGAAGLLALGTPVLNGRKRLILLSLAIFSFAAVAPGRRFYGHYWLQFLPVLALAMGALFYHLGKGLAVLFRRMNMQPVVAVAAAVILLLPVVRYSPTLFKGDSHRLLRAMSPGNPFVEDKVLSDVLKSKMRAGDRVAVLGSEPQYYIYLDKKAPSRHFYMAFTMRPIPESDAWQQEALGALTTLAPRFIVFNFVEYSWMPKEKSNMTLYEGSYKYARTNYRPIAWADMLSLKETKFILDESQARQYRPAGKRYVTVYEREEARNSSGVERSGQ